MGGECIKTNLEKRDAHRTDEDTRFETVLQEPTSAYNSDKLWILETLLRSKKKKGPSNRQHFSARINSILTTGAIIYNKKGNNTL